MKQKYFFPLNYNYSGKLLGIIDYQLIFPISIYAFILFLILKTFSISIFIKIVIFIFFFLPITLLLNSRINSEPFYTFIVAITKHYIKSKIYLYKRVIWCGINPNCITNETLKQFCGPEYLKYTLVLI